LEWKLIMTFSQDLNMLNEVSLLISKLSFGEETLETKKEEMKLLFKDYMMKL
jgi:hypothetical protein